MPMYYPDLKSVKMEITGGNLSKPSYYASAVIALYNDQMQEAYDHGYEDAKEDFGVTDE